jgi:hypothetical protein
MNLLDKYFAKLRFMIWAKLKANFYPSFYLSHSQFGEDMVLRFLSNDIKNGFYVDIGAHHPVYLSNTYHFYCKGWKGINIDAAPGSMELFHILRPKDTNLEACLSPDKDVELEFFIFEQAAYNTFDKAMADKALFLGAKLIEKRPLRTTTLKYLLDLYLPTETKIDLMTIDVEGMDEAILFSNNWEVYKPKFVVFEKHNISIQELDTLPLVKHLAEYGYKIVAKCGPSLILQVEVFN